MLRFYIKFLSNNFPRQPNFRNKPKSCQQDENNLSLTVYLKQLWDFHLVSQMVS